MRVRLTCVLLDTCGQYFDRGSSKKKLDCFLVYFQVYNLQDFPSYLYMCVGLWGGGGVSGRYE